MNKDCLLTLAVISLALMPSGILVAEEGVFEYPYYMLDVYNPDNDCWKGMDATGRWPVSVIPEQWLVGPPPAVDISGVTIPVDHWVELRFRGKIIDGPGDDILLVEIDPVGEQALVFVTDSLGQEYLLGLAAVPNGGASGPTEVGLDIAGVSLPFEPCAVRIVGIDLRGGSPGFDLSYVRARTRPECGYTACNPHPADGAENVPIDELLSWSPGCSAEEHTVYFGTALTDAELSADPVNSPSQPQEANSFDPCGLKLGETYYWRIDQSNSADVNSPWIGNIWTFRVTDHLVIDDFESYWDSWLFDVWAPVGRTNAYLSEKPDPVYRCQRSMALAYSQYSYSELVRMFDPAQDWASAGTESLELYFTGQLGNDPGAQMYISIGDGDVSTVVPYPGDANNLANEAWQLWRVNLQTLDVNLSRIESVSIGFSFAESEPMGTGSGTVFFDDIRIYPARCLDENRPAADFNGDCIVDFRDLDKMAYSWLTTGYNAYPIATPNAPVAWYEFEDNVGDSAGTAGGWLYGNPTYVTGVYGQAIKLDGYEDSVRISGVSDLFSKMSSGITIAFWQYGTASTHHRDTLCCSDYAYGTHDPVIAINLGCWHRPGRSASLTRSNKGKYNWDCGQPWSFDNHLSGNHRYDNEWSNRWNHWAFTKDTQAGEMRIYLNGTLYDSRTGSDSPISGITSFEIGSGWYGGYDGLIDDFRIYDYALSQPEIAHAATNGTGIFDQQCMSPADLSNDNRINFADFALLADKWLEDHLWP